MLAILRMTYLKALEDCICKMEIFSLENLDKEKAVT
jgi:hypothetical protein